MRDLQRLLAEGDFSATYKFALLRALADLSVERSDADQSGLELYVSDIAEKFIEYYWRQTRPFRDAILHQSGKGQAEVVTEVVRWQEKLSGSLSELRSRESDWGRLVKRVAQNVERDPLRRLQMQPAGQVCFLYDLPPVRSKGSSPENVSIQLKASAVRAFRQFHPLILSLIEGAWVRRIVSIRSNASLLGEGSDISEFLFGSDRKSLEIYRDVLQDVYGCQCFYCDIKPRRDLHVDHFIPWARYPSDVARNFVLACRACNENKSDHLASVTLLSRWKMANLDDAQSLAEALLDRGLPDEPNRALAVAFWAYEQAERSQALVWVKKGQFVHLGSDWRDLIGVPMGLSLAAEEAETYE